ncbi:hypothetical protein B0H65DRAFT_512277 [Neurospora tetraspora]|uniref:Uncharacterized protein n=1 Tax=Neurospora tetraspora TaxID=94610 RepID=A0AAE0MMV7_9PEZI|nr:hypothetical protein B0H65DRAFT_512277 [Neurospora tetraspora]
MRQYCTLTSSSYTCTNIVTGQTDMATFDLSQYYKLKVPVGLTDGVEKLVPPQDQYYSYNPTITILITNTPSISTNTLSNSTKPTTTINSSTTTVIPLHFPIVTKDAKDKDIHWGASLAYIDDSEIATYTVKCIDPKKAAIKDCESFYHGGITVQTGPMYYGYNFVYTVGSEWHTKDYHCHHPPSPGALKNGQDDIGSCTSIYGPTDAPTTKVSTSVTSMSASLANTTPVTVTEGVWKLSPKPTETKAEEGSAAGLDPGSGMGMGGDIGAVVLAGLVGVVVGVLGLVL